MSSPQLSEAAREMLESGGCSEVADDYVLLANTDIRILLSYSAVRDLNEQAKERAEP